MNTQAVADLLAGKEPVRVLVLASEKEVAELVALGLPANTVDSSLSMQHLASAKLAAERMQGKAGRLQVMTVTREEPQATEAERALIYAMLVRCRKVISCRDKLEDMLKFDDREGWAAYKQEYENKVLDAYKATWRDAEVYPYNIIDNIKEYNKNESYILKQLYWHLAERTPGRINDGDAKMINELRQMFSDISISLLAPDAVLVGDVAQDAQLAALAEMFAGKAEIIRL